MKGILKYQSYGTKFDLSMSSGRVTLIARNICIASQSLILQIQPGYALSNLNTLFPTCLDILPRQMGGH